MINKTIKLFADSSASVTTYILDDGEYDRKNTVRPAVVICPGGGYSIVSKNEGEPVALAYARQGYHAFVLTYSVKIDNPFPTALRELAKSVSIVRENSDEWLIDPNNISVIGFSAGGNLALSLGIYFNNPILTTDISLTSEKVKPNNLVLGYPAITLEPRLTETPVFIIEMMEQGLIPDMRGPNIQEILLGKENATKEEIDSLNLLHYIHENVPRTFVWGTYEDSVIPPTDLLGLCTKLFEYKIPCELHMFEKGPHGMSLSDHSVKNEDQINGLSLSSWFDLSVNWIMQRKSNE